MCCCCVRVSSSLACDTYCCTVLQGSSRHTAYSGMTLHTAAATTVALCCLFLCSEAFVTLHEMARNAGPRSVEIRRSFTHLQEQRQNRTQKQQHQQQQQQRGGGTGARHGLSCCRSADTGRTLLLRVPPAGSTMRHKRTALQQQQQQQQQYSSPSDTGRGVSVQQLQQQQLFHPNTSRTRTRKHGRCESSLVRRGMALSAGSGGGGEESNALLLRMDFEGADVEGLRTWIRRCEDVKEDVWRIVGMWVGVGGWGWGCVGGWGIWGGGG